MTWQMSNRSRFSLVNRHRLPRPPEAGHPSILASEHPHNVAVHLADDRTTELEPLLLVLLEAHRVSGLFSTPIRSSEDPRRATFEFWREKPSARPISALQQILQQELT